MGATEVTATFTGMDTVPTAEREMVQATSSAFEPLVPRLVRVRVGPDREPPRWLPYVLRRLNALALKLDEPGPDDLGLPDPLALERSLSELQSLLTDDTPSPSVVPTAEAGVQFVWHKGGWDLEVEVLQSETLAWGRNRESGARWAGPLADVRQQVQEAVRDIVAASSADRD